MIECQDWVQPRLLLIDLDEYIPRDHLLRAIKSKVSFKFVRDQVRHLYSDKGRPSIDPVRLVKMWLIGYLFGISSERRLEEEVRLNLAYRWFLDLQLDERIPDHSILSRNRNERFAGTTLFLEIFEEIVEQCKTIGLVKGEAVVTDSTHVKANASQESKEIAVVTRSPREYWTQLEELAQRMDAENRDDNGHGRRGLRLAPREPEVRERTQSRTDPDSGILARPGKPSGFHYLAHLTIEPSHGIILDADATPADISDHEPYLDCITRTIARHPVAEAAADAGYDYPEAHKGLHDLGLIGYIPSYQRRSGSESGRFTYRDFSYDSRTDTFVCPTGKPLMFSHIHAGKLQKTYSARTADCSGCPLKGQCLSPTTRSRKVRRPLLHEYVEQAHNLIGSPRYYELQRKRRVWCEGTFATMKARHCLGRAMRRGLVKMREQLYMAATAMNIVRMVRAIA